MREPASSLAKSSSRSPLLPPPRCTLAPSAPARCIEVSGKPGPFSWTQQATRPEREASGHRRYITRCPQIPSGALNRPNEQRDNNRGQRTRTSQNDAVGSPVAALNTQRDRGPLYQKDRENVTAGLTDIYESLLHDKLSGHRRSVCSNFGRCGCARVVRGLFWRELGWEVRCNVHDCNFCTIPYPWQYFSILQFALYR